MKQRVRSRSVSAIAVGVVCCGLIAGCSSGGGSDQKKDHGVASVSSPDVQKSKKPSTAKAQKKGVMVSPVMSEEERQAIHDAWYDCLETNGAEMAYKDGKKIPFRHGGMRVPKDPDARRPASAYKACEIKEPYVDPLYDKNTNPKYAEQTVAWMACMTRNGIEVSGNPDDEFLTYGKEAPELKNDPKARDKVRTKCYAESYK
jgi:hypothetical protein